MLPDNSVSTLFVVFVSASYYLALEFGNICHHTFNRFFDPARSGGHHLGFHPLNIEAFVKSIQFKSFLNGVLDDLEQTAADMQQLHHGTNSESARLVIAFYCNKGRHRSVSACTLMEEMLQREFKIHLLGS